MNTPTPKANSASDWIRGYFCAVAKMIELEGQVQPDAAELFRCGGDARRADLEDQEIFREHGLLPNTKGSRAEERKLTALTAEREKVGVLRSALENLCDEQNGAPLSTREEEWKQAMDKANAALAATEGAK
jgi:hypothetical protein